jgi:heme-degrading monooxygenase HmoA
VTVHTGENTMYVRTLYVTGDPGKIDDACKTLSTKGQKLLSDQPGYRGMSLLADRELGKLLVGTWWESEKTRQASDKSLAEQRAVLLSPFAQTIAIDNFEAAVVRPPTGQLRTGAGCRLSRLECAPSDADLMVDTFESTTLPTLEHIPGFAGASLFLDRSAGRAMVSVLYIDHKALATSRSSQAAARGMITAKAHVTLRSVEEFEVIFTTMIAPS